MKTTYSNGPWKVGIGLGPTKINNRVSMGKLIIAECPYGISSSSPDDYQEVEANARLIAAAPELLEALELCINELELHEKQATQTGDHDLLNALKVGREALARSPYHQ